MRKIKLLLSAVLALTLILCLATPALAADAGKVIYENSFDSGVLDDTFKVTRGTLSVAEEKGNPYLKVAHQTNQVHFAYGPTEQKDYDLTFRIRASLLTNEANATISPFFRSPHLPAWDTVSYQLQLKTFSASLIYADRFADDLTLSPLTEYDGFGISAGLWNNVKISTRGDRIIVYLNGDRVLETSDNKYGQTGGFGFTGRYASFDVDDIVITRYYGSTLPEPTPNEKPAWAGDISEKEEPDIPDTGVLRLDLTTLGQEKKPVNRAINYIDPAATGLYSWIALAAALICGGAATAGFIVLAKNKKEGDR